MCHSLTPELQTVIKEGGSCTVLDQPIPLDRLVVKSIDPLHVSGTCQFSSFGLSVCHHKVLYWPFLVTAHESNLSLHKRQYRVSMQLYIIQSTNLYGKSIGLGFQCLDDPALPLASYVTIDKELKFSMPQVSLDK